MVVGIAGVTRLSVAATTVRHTATSANAVGRVIQLPSGSHHPEAGVFGVDPLGVDPLGVDPLGVDPLGVDPLGVDPLGVDPLGVGALGVGASGPGLSGAPGGVGSARAGAEGN